MVDPEMLEEAYGNGKPESAYYMCVTAFSPDVFHYISSPTPFMTVLRTLLADNWELTRVGDSFAIGSKSSTETSSSSSYVPCLPAVLPFSFLLVSLGCSMI